jgi:hypothetical protein
MEGDKSSENRADAEKRQIVSRVKISAIGVTNPVAAGTGFVTG